MENNPHIVEGTIVSQANNTTARGVVADKLAHLGVAGNTIKVTNSGSGYEDGTYTDVPLLTVTGRGLSAVGIVTVVVVLSPKQPSRDSKLEKVIKLVIL